MGAESGGSPAYRRACQELIGRPRSWLVTGAAGFIGSHLVEELLRLGQRVRGLDNFATGHQRNLDAVTAAAGDSATGFHFVEGDIRDLATCREACDGVDLVLHQAALGSVPRSIEDPIGSNQANIDGTLNMLVAARDAGARRFVYAASSSTYGDSEALPKEEGRIGRPLSPYAVTKYVNELYADVFQRVYGLETVGLRYFNVFGPRQDPSGAYAAVVPRWIQQVLSGESCLIHGDGETSRDFTYVASVVQANLLAATSEAEGVAGEVFNVAAGGRTTLNELHAGILSQAAREGAETAGVQPRYGEFRLGDVRHSQASIEKIRRRLGYEPAHTVDEGLAETVAWFAAASRAGQASRT